MGERQGMCGQRGPGGLSVLSAQICYEPKTSLKNHLFKYFKEIEIIVS